MARGNKRFGVAGRAALAECAGTGVGGTTQSSVFRHLSTCMSDAFHAHLGVRKKRKTRKTRKTRRKGRKGRKRRSR